MSAPRVGRYVSACQGDTRKAMALYRLNLRLSQELFTVVSCFEIALRNAIDQHYLAQHGADWLRNAASPGGFFNNNACKVTADVVLEALRKLGRSYTHPKLIAELGFGFWRFMFATHQYRAAGQTLIHIFPNKPRSTPQQQYNSTYVFNQLKQINDLRNRLAHHEPVCFSIGAPVIDTAFAREHYQMILQFFQWLDINENELLYGLDHVDKVIARIDDFV